MIANQNKKSSASQCTQIKRWLMGGNKITALEALSLFGCMRLASRICELREQGLNIHKERIITSTGKLVTQYSLAV